MRTPSLVLLVVAVATIPAASGGCVPTTSQPEVDTGPAGPVRFYFDNDPCQPCMWTFWIYQESNGIDGLQRQDEVKDDTCGGPERGGIQGDTIVF